MKALVYAQYCDNPRCGNSVYDEDLSTPSSNSHCTKHQIYIYIYISPTALIHGFYSMSRNVLLRAVRRVVAGRLECRLS